MRIDLREAAFHRAKKFIYATISFCSPDFLLVPEDGETLFDIFRSRRKDGVDVRTVVWEPARQTSDTIPDPLLQRSRRHQSGTSNWDTPAHDSLDVRRVAKGEDTLKGLEATPRLHNIFYRITGLAVGDVVAKLELARPRHLVAAFGSSVPAAPFDDQISP